jgi:hypothetical protein
MQATEHTNVQEVSSDSTVTPPLRFTGITTFHFTLGSCPTNKLLWCLPTCFSVAAPRIAGTEALLAELRTSKLTPVLPCKGLKNYDQNFTSRKTTSSSIRYVNCTRKAYSYFNLTTKWLWYRGVPEHVGVVSEHLSHIFTTRVQVSVCCFTILRF